MGMQGLCLHFQTPYNHGAFFFINFNNNSNKFFSINHNISRNCKHHNITSNFQRHDRVHS